MRAKIIGFFVFGLLISGAALVSAAVPHAALQAAIPTAAPMPMQLPDSVFAQIDAMDQAVTNLYQRISPSVVHVTADTQMKQVRPEVIQLTERVGAS